MHTVVLDVCTETHNAKLLNNTIINTPGLESIVLFLCFHVASVFSRETFVSDW